MFQAKAAFLMRYPVQCNNCTGSNTNGINTKDINKYKEL